MTRPVLNSYFLDRPLSEVELAEVQEMMGVDLVQIRIPYILPTPEELPDGAWRMPAGSEDAPLAALKAAGILSEYGRRAVLVAPVESGWAPRFADAIARLTGSWPYLVQTTEQRAAIGNLGEIRVLDLDRAMEG